jgi:histidinol-phosphate aminotransferase
MNPLDLVREDLRGFGGYASARRSEATGSIWLNANESPWPNPADTAAPACHRYPEPQPTALRGALADLYGVAPEQLLIGRGSDEAIDLLVRACCRPQHDAIAIAPPVFGMYAVCARLQGARLIELPLRDSPNGFVCDLEALAEATLAAQARLVFLCSPANPTGQSLRPREVLDLVERLSGRALVVVDEASVEFSDETSLAAEVAGTPGLAVLRTLSKAHALAGARIGCLIAAPELIDVLRNCQAPYPLPLPSVQLALQALAPGALAQTRMRVSEIRNQRARLQHELASLSGVVRVYASQGNYLLVRFADPDAVLRRLREAGIVVRDMRSAPQLGDALRLSVGSADENSALLQALAMQRTAA